MEDNFSKQPRVAPHHYSQVAELSCSHQQKVAEQSFDKTVIGSHKQIFNVFSF